MVPVRISFGIFVALIFVTAMPPKLLFSRGLLAALFLLCCHSLKAQFLMDMLDTTKEAGKGLLGIYKKYDHLRIGGYLQPQFQVADTSGARSFEGGNFSPHVNNRFMLRRSRVRIDYAHIYDPEGPGVQMVFQFDANERSFTVRDIWGRVFENRYKMFAFTIGMFARPFGYETNLSSADRESPERGRMNQILMKSERDLGAMVSFDVRREKHPLKWLRLDLGLFNGQGINADGDFDNHKDLISRLALKPLALGKRTTLSAGFSWLEGGLRQNTPYVFNTLTANGVKGNLIDSAATNTGRISPRHYRGLDVQVRIKNRVGYTECRAEYITGVQSGTANSSETPAALLQGTDGFYRRHFNGAYFYFLHNLFSTRHQLVIKYDWYDPNTRLRGTEIGAPGSNTSLADVKYSTLQIGYNYAVTPLVKLSLFYARVHNETTQLPGATRDLPDNIFTSRLQFRF